MPSTRRTPRGAPAKGAQSKLSFTASKRTPSIGKDPKSVTSTPEPSQKSNLSRVESVSDIKDDIKDDTSIETPEAVTLEGDKKVTKVKIGAKGKGEKVEKAEAEAREVTEEEVQRWWAEKQGERIAPRVHQEGVSTPEKILRLFDMSSQYGPCIGSPRTTRWHRAQRLGLEPPIEVLAVMLQEEAARNLKKGQESAGNRAHLEELLATMIGPDN